MLALLVTMLATTGATVGSPAPVTTPVTTPVAASDDLGRFPRVEEARIYVLLVDRDGRVHWRASGPFDAPTAEGLQRHLADSPPSPQT